MATVRWSESAVADVDAVVQLIARDSIRYALRFEEEIVRRPRILERFPDSGQMVPEFQNPLIREVRYGAYRVVYQIRGDVCVIVAVVHGSRDMRQAVDPANWPNQ